MSHVCGKDKAMTSEKYLHILKQYWGYDSFRGIQEDIIGSIGRGEDTLGLMHTGGGKSIAFQVPALAMEGLCLVVTPLIALMKDQVQHLRHRGIKAQAVYSGMSRQDMVTALENCIYGNYKFLYVSPERLATDIFRIKLCKMHICLIAVDESHCISQWGYDFRPAYLKIAEIRALLPGVPVLALTATATPEVVKDIQKQLLFPKENVFRMSFERENLAYVVRYAEDKQGELLHILHRTEGSAIVYARNRKRTREIAERLNRDGITATFYHAGLNDMEKDLRQQRWNSGEIRVIVATNAFGMGIDKPDVRVVVHVDLPDSIESYFQEAGRAGRDGGKAYAVLLYRPSDKTALHKRIADTYPDKDYITGVYEHLQYFFQMAMGDGLGCMREFDLDKFCMQYGYFPVPVVNALKILTQAGYLEFTDEEDCVSRLLFTLQRDELYRLHGLDERTEQLVQVVLRSYTGLFTDYAFINEDLLATRAGMTRHQVYDLLSGLSRMRIVSYIPRKKIPYIIYTRERIDKKYIHLSPDIYEKRKEQYAERIESILYYAENENVCRSRILLRYFGEKNEHKCGICDVCLSQRKRDKAMEASVRQRALDMLADAPMSYRDMLRQMLDVEGDSLIDALQDLVENGLVSESNGTFHLTIKK